MVAADPLIRVLSSQEDILAAEALQRRVWGTEDVVPFHLLWAGIHHGSLLLGAFLEDQLVGLVYGFPDVHYEGSEAVISHHSHMLGVLPEFRDRGIGFLLKRAQWQIVRKQGIERITWTYDPLQSRNAFLNISRIGAVCSVYLPNYYGEMSDQINAGYPSDRFQVDLWVNTSRARDRMSRNPRRSLELGDYFSAGAEIVNPTRLGPGGLPQLPDQAWSMGGLAETLGVEPPRVESHPPFYLVEIPPDIQEVRQADPDLALNWRLHTRQIFRGLFEQGYIVTDFIFMRGESPRSFYVLSDGERRLGGFRKS